MFADPTGLLKYLGAAGFFVPIWLFHLVPLLVVSAPIWLLARKRVNWNGCDFAIVLLPFAVWSALMLVHGTGKTLSNLVEGLIIGCVAPVAPAVRAILGRRLNQKATACGLLLGLCAVAASLWAFVPALPE